MHLSGSEKPFRSAQSGAVQVCKAQNKPRVEPNQPQEPPSSFSWEFTAHHQNQFTSYLCCFGQRILRSALSVFFLHLERAAENKQILQF